MSYTTFRESQPSTCTVNDELYATITHRGRVRFSDPAATVEGRLSQMVVRHADWEPPAPPPGYLSQTEILLDKDAEWLGYSIVCTEVVPSLVAQDKAG